MESQRLTFIYTVFDLVSLLFNVPGSYIYGSEGNRILKYKKSRIKDTVYEYRSNKFIVDSPFTTETDFKEYLDQNTDVEHLYLVDANELTDKQIEDLLTASKDKRCSVYVFAHMYVNGDENNKTQTFKSLSKYYEDVTFKKIGFACRCGTYDVKITERSQLENISAELNIHDTIWYTECNVNCNDHLGASLDDDYVKKTLKSDEFASFIEFLKAPVCEDFSETTRL